MASHATINRLMPLALKLGGGNEPHAHLARVLVGCRPMMIVFIVFPAPAGFDLFYGRQWAIPSEA